MGSYYALFTEIKVNNKWICLNRRVPVIGQDSKTKLTNTYSSCSRSYFHETAEKLEQIGSRISLDELSQEVRDVYCEAYKSWREYFWATATGLDAIINAFPSDEYLKENHGYVSKNALFLYQTGEMDDINDYLTVDEYVKLDEEAKKCYQYYEWNDEMGWFKYFVEIREHIHWQLYEWRQANEEFDIEKVRLICVTQ